MKKNSLILKNNKFDAKNKIITNVLKPEYDKDVVNKIDLDSRDIWLTIKDDFQTFTKGGFKKVNFDMMSSKLLDQEMRLSTDMYMKISIYLKEVHILMADLHVDFNIDKRYDTLIELKINGKLILTGGMKARDSATCFAYGKHNDIITFSILPEGESNTLKPYIHIEKILFLNNMKFAHSDVKIKILCS